MNHAHHVDREELTRRLRTLGFKGSAVYLVELVIAVEMAWADGEVQPNERALLEAYCEALVEQLNATAGARLFTTRQALDTLARLLRRRLRPYEREWVLDCVRRMSAGRTGDLTRKRVMQWCEAIGAVDGSPVWDARELFWLQRVRTVLEAV